MAMDPSDLPTAMETTPSGPTRSELADAGVTQLHTLVRTTKQLLDAYRDLGTSGSASVTATDAPDTLQAAATAPAAPGAPAAAIAQASEPRAAVTGAGTAAQHPSHCQAQPVTDVVARVRLLQQRYVDTSAALRSTLQQCAQLQEAESLARQAAAAASGPGTASGEQAQQQEQQQQQQQLAARAQELRRQLAQKQALLKQVVDKLRHLMDAFVMWDTHAKQMSAS